MAGMIGDDDDDVQKPSIYKLARSIKKRHNSLYNALRSIYQDSIFVLEIAGLYPTLPLLANLRCGLWYSSRFHATCYFKSTDGHQNNCSFSTARLNLHVALLAGQKGGCVIVDSTRKGKRFPDSMSKTIPIWACVVNRAVERRLKMLGSQQELKNVPDGTAEMEQIPLRWDCSLHLPLWVPDTEKATIEARLDEWTEQLETCGADIDSLVPILRKPLRPLWISQRTLIWLNEVPEYDSWDFTPIILVSASATSGMIEHTMSSEFSWNYIPGAGDDEESWARGLSPTLFWKHAFDLIDSGPDLCNKKVADIVEKERVYRSQRGELSPQITVKREKSSGKESYMDHLSELVCSSINFESSDKGLLSWIGSTNIAVGKSCDVVYVSDGVDCVLNCDSKSVPFCSSSADAYLHLPIVSSKMDRFILMNSLSSAINFAKLNLNQQKKLLICCQDGEDISVCICLAIITALFDEKGLYNGGKSFMDSSITKWEMRKRLVFICNFAVNARPSRGNLKQVFGFLSREKDSGPAGECAYSS